MSNLEKVILKAKEKGWGEYYSLEHYEPSDDAEIVLDPLFWQALGKAEGWTTIGHCPVCWDSEENIPAWEYHWLSFIKHLAEGKDSNSFFEELLK